MTSKAKLEIRRSVAKDAKDRVLFDRVVAIVNTVYFSPRPNNGRTKRTNNYAGDNGFAFNVEIAAGIRERTARRRGKNREIEPKTAGFGMLATDPNGLQRGVGKALVGAAETWVLSQGFGEMEIEIVRAENLKSHNQLLHDRHTRLNYIEITTFLIIEHIPEIALTKANLRWYRLSHATQLKQRNNRNVDTNDIPVVCSISHLGAFIYDRFGF